MMHNVGRRSCLGLILVVCLHFATVGFGQQKKGAFVDGEFVEDYVYVAEFMAPEELKKQMDERSSNIVIVDTAATLIFEEEHIPGAVSFPWVKSITPPVTLPRDKTLVIYCACKDHEDSVDMAQKLSVLGYLNIKVLKGGWFKWLDLKYKTISSADEKAGK
jgi:3-mercaptopyruvate sulfurtransferase SseA